MHSFVNMDKNTFQVYILYYSVLQKECVMDIAWFFSYSFAIILFGVLFI